jgi:hypothetical protein
VGEESDSAESDRYAKSQFRSTASSKNLPQGWTFAEWQSRKERQAAGHDTEQASVKQSPWSQADGSTAAKRASRKETDPELSHGSPAFPHSSPVWRSSANEPLTRSSSEVDAPGIAVAKDGHRLSQVVQADLNAGSSVAESAAEEHVLVPRAFPENSPFSSSQSEAEEREPDQPDSLASVIDWRTQDLTDVATNRAPLLVSPLPSGEVLGTEVIEDAAEESVAVDIQEPDQTPQESKLWMILAAAAGAFAMLFVRRRPAPVVRSSGDGR